MSELTDAAMIIKELSAKVIVLCKTIKELEEENAKYRNAFERTKDAYKVLEQLAEDNDNGL